ncbi:Scarecrow-like protein [Drosera capensis]
MLAGCSSTLLSRRHRSRAEGGAGLAGAQFQACTMSTQRLDLPTSFTTFPHKDVPRSQPTRPVVLSTEQPKTGPVGSLKQHSIRKEMKAGIWETTSRRLKRSADDIDVDESCFDRIKRKKESFDHVDDPNDENSLSFGFGSESIWVQPGFQFPRCGSRVVEERVCFVPSEIISSPSTDPSRCPWVASIVNEVTNFGKNDGEIGFKPVKEASGSASSSQSPSLGPEESASDHELGNGAIRVNAGEGTTNNSLGDQDDDQRVIEQQGFELVSLLVRCVEAISSRNVATISYFISMLGDSASPRGTSAVSRLVAYFTEALALRVARVWPNMFQTAIPRELDPPEDDTGMALRVLNHISPIPRFIHFTANEMILRAFEGKDRVHIIDFDIKQGLQWPSLFQSLALRSNPPSHVRITGVGMFKQELLETGERLSSMADALKLPFEFHAVVDRWEDVRLWMLHVKEKETVAINCIFQMHKMLYDGNKGVLNDFLGLIRSTNATMMVMAEQEADHNEAHFEKRVCKSLKYYSAIFDSIDSSLPVVSSVRIKVEEGFARELRNIVACEGPDRFERHESFVTWRRSLEQGGFRCLGVNERESLQTQMILKMYGCDCYNLEKQKDSNHEHDVALTLKWLDQPLYTVSAWVPGDVSGSSSSFSHPTS